MSRIDELIARLCPGGVERKTFAEVGRLVRGHGMPKTDFVEAGVGAIHYGQIYTYYGTWTTSTRSFVSPETAARLAKVGSSPRFLDSGVYYAAAGSVAALACHLVRDCPLSPPNVSRAGRPPPRLG